MPNKIAVFRIEHKVSKLGPFQHAKQIAEVVAHGIYHYPIIHDIDSIPEVKKLLKQYPYAKFGFISYERCCAFIKNKDILIRHGFHIAIDWVTPLYINEIDGQVLYIPSTI